MNKHGDTQRVTDKTLAAAAMSPARRAWRSVPEWAVMIAIVLAAGFLFRRDDPFLLRLNPHPFWAIILLIALRYGAPAGAICAAACAAAHVAGLWHRGGELRQLLETDGWNLTVPFLYLAAGFGVGESVEARIQVGAHLNRLMDELRARIAAGDKQRAEIESAYRQLESRVAAQPNTFIALYESARRLDSLEEPEILAGLVEVLRDHLKVERCGAWLRAPDGTWRRAAPEGEGAAGAPLPRLGLKAAQDNAVVSVLDHFAHGGFTPEDGILAGPLRDAAGAVDGVVVVEAMGFVGFNRTMIKVFDLLLDWASRSRLRAREAAEARVQKVQDAEMDMRTEAYWRARVKEDLALAARQGAPASLLLCRVALPLPAEAHRRVTLVLARIFRNFTRTSDCVACFEAKPALAMFLPDATPEGVEIVRRKLEEAVRELHLCPLGDDRPLELRWGQATRTDKADLDELIRQAYAACEGDAA